MLKNDDFVKIKELTNGCLTPEIYQALFSAAYDAPDGLIVDVGPAQGGSTISFGLGRKQKGLVPDILTIDVFKQSNSLKDLNDVNFNID
ncbi:MAG: hypothetical protein LBR74_10145, partial [Eubacterium sp.]|nr:hypothetical protein [Eubacterium sp.]